MKRLVCEMCGSNDIVKQDGLFVCQNCGTKYSVEEARKMMIEGTVDVSGSSIDVSGSTVNISNEERISNLYQVARRFRDDNNVEAGKYYAMILEEDPNSWEASFFVVYFKAMACKIAEIKAAAISISNCLHNVFILIRSHVPSNQQSAATYEIVRSCSNISNFLFFGAKKSYYDINPTIQNQYIPEYVDRMSASRDILYICGNKIDEIFSSYNKEIAKIADGAWRAGINLHETQISEMKSLYFLSPDAEQQERNRIRSYANKIGKYNKKDRLDAEIKTLRNNAYSIQSENNPKWRLIVGIFLVALALLNFILSFITKDGSSFMFFAMLYLLGFGGFLIYKYTKKKKDIDERLKNIYSEINMKEEELQKLR